MLVGAGYRLEEVWHLTYKQFRGYLRLAKGRQSLDWTVMAASARMAAHADDKSFKLFLKSFKGE